MFVPLAVRAYTPGRLRLCWLVRLRHCLLLNGRGWRVPFGSLKDYPPILVLTARNGGVMVTSKQIGNFPYSV